MSAVNQKLHECSESEEADTMCREPWRVDLQESMVQEKRESEVVDSTKDKINKDEFCGEYFSAAEGHENILVYFSSHCVSKGTVCERTRLLRIKFYGSFDKPFERYLYNSLFDETYHCESCKEPAEAHVVCFTHQQGNLTINVRRLPSVKLPGESDGKIWMWQRCLRCPFVDGVPPVTQRVVMPKSAWGLSFGKFLELSFSNRATADRVANCGHSLQSDCLRFYGKVTGELFHKMETLYVEISDVLEQLETKLSNGHDIHNHILDLKNTLEREKMEYRTLLKSADMTLDILELNRLRRSLLIGSHVWDHKLSTLDSLTKTNLREKLLELDDQLESPKRINLILSSTPSFLSSISHIAEGARLLLPQTCHGDRIIAVYDNDYSSIISYALTSKDYEDWVSRNSNSSERNKQDLANSCLSAWPTLDIDYINYASYVSDDAHAQISFEDNYLGAVGKVNFSVTCYFAKQFDSLRKRCCPNEVDYVRSLTRCQRWSAQGGKSNAYFAKSVDERFVIKQVTKTEFESFQEFAPQYFKYLMDAMNSGGPTCLAKILGIYQVTVKYPKGGKETKIDLIVMENLFYKRNITTVYDLKGSERSRYNADTTGTNKVMLDMNLLETLRTNPIFLGFKAKRKLERAVWNDTSFLASVAVMDYSLLVGVDDEKKELVLGIIDFMRQYTWDKHLETWVKASGILGGPKNASPTIVSPKQYKKRFRKAMTTYFLTLPDQWSC
ncbi:unnamed protein product [Vicia faba]|uniref:PIPK domain-containing protein n=1 Tax=Vicia faba TaxID=3906 RepID=A0AAV1B3P9_VICFA|nr:unnamed protein product [Vicia faba]